MTVSTPRLLLRPPVPDDAVDVLTMLQDAANVRWNPVAEVVDLASARDWCLRMADRSSGDHATWHAVTADSGQFVGYVSIFGIDRDHKSAKVGYRTHPWHRGNGYAKEAVTAATDWAFASLDLVRIQLEHSIANPASCAVAVGAGYRLEGQLRSSYLEPSGQRHDEHVHGRLATDPR